MEKFRNIEPYIHFVAIIVCMICSIYVLTLDVVVLPKYISGIALIALCFAIHYAYNRFSKKAAISYKAYMIVCAIYFQACACANGIAMGSMPNKVATGSSVAINCLIFGIFLVLGTGLDLGKKTTFTLCAIAEALTLMGLLVILFTTKGIFRGGNVEGTVMIFRTSTRLALVGVACMMMSFKYQDKEKRGTK